MRDGRAAVAPLTWSLWGGAVEPADADAFAAAVRELEEELNLRVDPSELALVAMRRGRRCAAEPRSPP